jgi:tellurite resistance protein
MLEQLKKRKICRLDYFNIAFFAAIMWFGWLSLATHKLEEVYKIWGHFSNYILYFTILFFAVISSLYIIKIFKNFDEVKADFYHSVRSNFFPGIWKILLIFSIGFLSININIAQILWRSWTIWQFLFTVFIFRRWMLHEIDIKEMNPLWFLPIVGNLLVPVAWIKLWFIESSRFFFSIGIIMWLVLFIIIMNRIIFHHPLSTKVYPTLIILIAPPAVGLISITSLYNGELLTIWKILYYFALFMFIVLATKINIFSKLKFYMSWWAYSFPVAVLTTATILLYSKTNIFFFKYLGIFFYIILLVIMIILIYRTIPWIKKRELCIEE